MIKAFIFDFGGVIVRTEDYRPRHAWDERLGLPVGSVERAVHHSDIWIQAQLGRISYKSYWDGVAEILYMRKDDHDIEALRRDYFSGDRINYRLVCLIRELREQGYGIALLSNESVELRQRLDELGLTDLFDHILISAEIGVMKPDVTAFRVALQALGVAPHEAVFVDDALPNVRGAQHMGLHVIHSRACDDLRPEVKRLLEMSDTVTGSEGEG